MFQSKKNNTTTIRLRRAYGIESRSLHAFVFYHKKAMKNRNEYFSDYKKNRYERFTVLIPKTETEVIERLEQKKPLNKYFIDLVKEDINNEKIIKRFEEEAKKN